MNKYKAFEELKEELGDKFEDYMYQSNIELLKKIDSAILGIERIEEIIKQQPSNKRDDTWILSRLAGLKFILNGDDNE